MAMANAERLVELTELVKTSIGGSLVAAAFSGIANLLMLVPAFYMLNVYDKAVGSNSLPTLLMLSIVTAIMFLGLGPWRPRGLVCWWPLASSWTGRWVPGFTMPRSGRR